MFSYCFKGVNPGYKYTLPDMVSGRVTMTTWLQCCYCGNRGYKGHGYRRVAARVTRTRVGWCSRLAWSYHVIRVTWRVSIDDWWISITGGIIICSITRVINRNYTIQCAVYIRQYIVHAIICTVYIVHCTLYTVQCTVYIVRYTMCSLY